MATANCPCVCEPQRNLRFCNPSILCTLLLLLYIQNIRLTCPVEKLVIIIVIIFIIAHSCKYPGCQEVLVLDGNMKNRRAVCLAKDAGFVEYTGLPGHTKTGCMALPHYKSRYCQQHMIQAISTTENATECRFHLN